MYTNQLENLSHLFLRAPNGHPNIPIVSTGGNHTLQLSGQEVSDLVWVPLDLLYLRSDRLRAPGQLIPTGEFSAPSNHDGPTDNSSSILTPSVSEICMTYLSQPEFNGEPILVHSEQIPEQRTDGIVVYEGRHRSVGAFMAGRKLILSRFIGKDHPRFQGQHSSDKPAYYGKPMFTLEAITNLHRRD